MYLIDDSKTDASSFTGIHMGNLTFNVLRSKSQIAGLNIVSETKQDFNLSGNYKPIVVVSDKDGKILDIQYVELSVFIVKENQEFKDLRKNWQPITPSKILELPI